MNFSNSVLSNAVKSINGELAWDRSNVTSALDELADEGNAILGGEAWAAVSKSEMPPLTKLEDGRLALGLIEGKDGTDCVFQWSSEKKESEPWNEYVQRARTQAINMIREMDVENNVSTELAKSIFYNLTFVSEAQYQELP